MSEHFSLAAYSIDPDDRDVKDAHSFGGLEEDYPEGKLSLGGIHVGHRIRYLAKTMGCFRQTDEIQFNYAGYAHVSYASHIVYDGNWFDAPYQFLRLLTDAELMLLESHSYHWNWSTATIIEFLSNYGKKCFLLCIMIE